ncbi:hypothetical protein [Hymenobacter nivis]|uniref:Uncharacterized protein n=1 Tax=Hymenobacter nivis TaxID=1850093 RepID=A0A2Z3GEP6_9BACT|nr:hypothetical protein [Hymenobacter nivis]AWM31993.1 hypothetical protein DDQ68_03800 [Hymenobacter nivis]
MLGSRTSPYLQEKLALLSTLTVFGQVPGLVEQLLGLRVNQSQVYRQCQRIADALDEQQLSKANSEVCVKLLPVGEA